MAETIKAHFFRQKIAYMLFMLVAAIGIGMYVSFIFINQAKAAVATVVGSDPDTTGFGLNGNDVRVAVTVSGDAPTGFENMRLYVATSTAVLSTTTLNTACNNAACNLVGIFNQHNNFTFTLTPNITKDSANETWVTTASYTAWVFVSSTNPVITSSSQFRLTSEDNITDTAPPFIEHMSAHTAFPNATATLHALIMDDQTTSTAFANVNDGGSEYARVLYRSGSSGSFSTATATQVAGDLFSFLIPSSTVSGTGATFQYYLEVSDRSGNIQRACVNSSSCTSNPFTTNVFPEGARTIAGTITSGGSALANANVFAAGF
ncbi:MAG: hypothetical protein AAB932_03380, partial [Patescibacteria group bacterium]